MSATPSTPNPAPVALRKIGNAPLERPWLGRPRAPRLMLYQMAECLDAADLIESQAETIRRHTAKMLGLIEVKNREIQRLTTELAKATTPAIPDLQPAKKPKKSTAKKFRPRC